MSVLVGVEVAVGVREGVAVGVREGVTDGVNVGVKDGVNVRVGLGVKVTSRQSGAESLWPNGSRVRSYSS